jgi:hypothetical protein
LEVRADPVIAALSVALIGGSMIVVMLVERLVGLRFVVR